MRAVLILALVALAGCAEQKGPLTQAYEGYSACLKERPETECGNERAKFEAAKQYADSVSRRTDAINTGSQPLILGSTAPAYYPQRQGVTCVQNGAFTNCF